MSNTPPKRRARRQFTEEFKQQAARPVLDDGKSMAAVAGELDLVPTALRKWSSARVPIAPAG
jgi:transposase